MKSYALFVIVFCALIFAGCGSTSNSSASFDTNEQNPQIVNPQMSISLADHLSRVAGVRIQGNGTNAKVYIRGVSSFTGDNEALFVVDGRAIDGGLQVASQFIPVAEISTIRVLKNPSDTGIYGVRGANGVIEIRLKNG